MTARMEALSERFRPVFAQIAAGAVDRESDRDLPFEPVRLLAEAGFGAVRVPEAFGGSGATLEEFFALLIELGAADSNLPQALRAHFGKIEERIHDTNRERGELWLRRIAGGAIFGNAVTEIGGGTIGAPSTTLRQQGDRWVVNGSKHYSTGSLFADWVAVSALNENGEPIMVAIEADADGLTLVDNWDGFGQRLTGSGTTELVDVQVDPANFFPIAERGQNYMTAFYQNVLLASLAGIGRAVVTDAVEYVQPRTRIFSHGTATLPREDPLVQQVVGQLSALSLAADALVLTVARSLDRLNEKRRAGTLVDDDFLEPELLAARAQVVVVESVLRASTQLFEVGGASSVQESRRLDRHWRNARTISVHNPVIYKQRVIGDNLLNGTRPPFSWIVGVASGTEQKAAEQKGTQR
jgi:alkylation response protein AidB-like acyl-CoA dehydrogenase